MNVKSKLEKNVKETVIKAGVDLLDKNPEKNVDRLFSLIRKSIKDQYTRDRIDVVTKYYTENETTHQFIQSILKETDKNCMKKFFANFFGNAAWYGIPKREQLRNENGTKIPFTILISPSMRCNLRCTGCYAGNYSKKDDIPFEELDRIISEARELGIYYFVILGGEPFFNEYMYDIYKKYDDCYFTPFTNGTLFNEEIAEKLQKLGNVMPMFSLEGFEEETDARRGKGVFAKVMHGMDLLKAKGVPFGVSSATGTKNFETVTSDKFIDMLIEKGARMSWFFIYMPVGENPSVKDMLTPEQRIELGKRTRRMRTTKPYFAIDFFNDAPYVGGCIAGKFYCHINSKEDLEPCIFAHFAYDNVKGKKLEDAFAGPYFKELQSRQPYNQNLLRPCMMIDNPNVVREVVKKVGAYPTHPGAEKMVEDPQFMSELDKLAEDFAPYAAKAWKEDFDEKGNLYMAKG